MCSKKLMQNKADMHTAYDVKNCNALIYHILTYFNLNFKSGVLLLYTRLSESYMATKAPRKLRDVPAFIVSLKYYQQHQNSAKQGCFPLNRNYRSKKVHTKLPFQWLSICATKTNTLKH